jgi:hypothetical protein
MQNKNIGHFLAFTPDWFAKHQKFLLFLCNAPLIKYWFRYVLRIHKFDCPLDVKITELAPNHFSYGDKIIYNPKDKTFKRERTTDFRTHPKFAKRIYFAFKPMWWAFHAWDWLVADRFVKTWSWGFSTLTAYPVPGTTTDGWAASNGETNLSWSAIRGRTGDAHDNTSAYDTYILIRASGTGNNSWQYLYRSIFLFDTSGLTSAATISATVLSLYSTAATDGAVILPDIDIYTSTPASNTALANGDYSQLGSTSQTGSPITYVGWNTVGYNDFTFNSTGRGNVSKTSISKFGARNQNYDASNSLPNALATDFSYLVGYFSDNAGTTSDPKLVVTYTVPSLASGFFRLM